VAQVPYKVDEQEIITEVKWQAVMIIAPNRLECHECGSLALFVLLEEREKETVPGIKDYNHTCYCQDCFQKEQEREE
jgi:hypothetical protein